MPKRCKPVYGVALLWQPEVVYVYRAVIEQYSSSSEAVEAAPGAIQNLTACNWKVQRPSLTVIANCTKFACKLMVLTVT